MKIRFQGMAALAAIVVSTGCYRDVTVGPYVRSLQVDSSGRVTGVESCTSTLTVDSAGRISSWNQPDQCTQTAPLAGARAENPTSTAVP